MYGEGHFDMHSHTCKKKVAGMPATMRRKHMTCCERE